MSTIVSMIAGSIIALMSGNGSGGNTTVEKHTMTLIASEGAAATCGFDYVDAEARLKVKENLGAGTTTVTIKLDDAVPDMIYTVWMFAPVSPLTGAPATPLAPTHALADLALSTPPAAGSTEGANAFWTDEDGDGKLKVELDFLLSDGVYPFAEGDVTLGSVPFSLRVISHCVDDVSHGLLPGVHEPTFQISL